jgi:hypothetical protein
MAELNLRDGSRSLRMVRTAWTEWLVVRETACDQSVTATTPPQEPVPRQPDRRLIPPMVLPTLRHCQDAVFVAQVLPGARVRVLRDGGPAAELCFHVERQWLRVDPLQEGERISAFQYFAAPGCEARSGERDGILVEPTRPLPRPTVATPICRGTRAVTLTGLIPGASVYLFGDNEAVGVGGAPASSFSFPAPSALSGHEKVSAMQELCGVRSDPSEEVPLPASLHGDHRTVDLMPPLYACTTQVRVIDALPGAHIVVRSARLGAISDVQHVLSPDIEVAVAPALRADDEISVVQTACGRLMYESRGQPVQRPALQSQSDPVVVPPLFHGDRSVRVRGALAGAVVDVYVDGEWRGRATAAGMHHTVVQLTEPHQLHVHQQVQARQRLCDVVTSRMRPGVPVIEALPIIISMTDIRNPTWDLHGGFDWGVIFATTGTSGWIVQKVKSEYWGLRGSGIMAPRITPEYWEAWTVSETSTITPLNSGTHDDWRRDAFWPGTQGNWSMRGTLYFTTTNPATMGFRLHGAMEAGDLLSTDQQPPQGFGASLLERSAGGTWDSMGATPTHIGMVRP